jgi:uncharacterized protein YcbX
MRPSEGDPHGLDQERIMPISGTTRQDSIAELWRYPVKSMLGEELDAADVTERGLLGDRAYALVDVETGKVVSAKNPRKWGNLFDFRAAFVEPVSRPGPIPAARITLPDGVTVQTDEPGVDDRLSALVGRPVRLASSAGDTARIEGYWPDYDWLESPDVVFEFEPPPGTFFDGAVVHVVTIATLGRLRSLSPQSRFDVSRFRPNLVVATSDGAEGFAENEWVGRTISLGAEVRLRITDPCPRCVMTTLSQGDLPNDPNILRTVVQNNGGNVGVLAAVLPCGRIRRGDAVVVE